MLRIACNLTSSGRRASVLQWECKSELPAGISLGETTVNCEGYSHPDDEYILRGSCGLEYELRWTTPRPGNTCHDCCIVSLKPCKLCM